MLFEKQQYQEDCVDNILEVLRDNDYKNNFSSLQQAIETLHSQNDIPIKELQKDTLRLDILMETGTGKTFTYIKAMYQLNKEYGFNKFIIFVPRIAIREGVIQNIDLTSDYFFTEYNKRLKKYTYGDKAGRSQVSTYIRNKDELSVLILTSASITGNDRILKERYEGLLDVGAKSPLDAIRKLKPIIFIDEPHLLKGDAFVKTYNEFFNESLCLRFGATFPDGENAKLANVVYTLDSLSAFQQYLVKKIRVSTIIDKNAGIQFSNPSKDALTVHYFKENIEHSPSARKGTDLGALTENPAYQGVSIVNIKKNKVYLSDGTAHDTNKSDYALEDASIRLMVRQTIKFHFEKEEKLFKQGIKTLSLFFIPNVKDFRGDNPRIKTIFEEEYKTKRDEILQKNLNPAYREYLAKDYDDSNQLRVHDGYFSGDKGTKDDREAAGVNLILKQKKNLLSTETSLRFIFSVWALQEGWDNPNIFNICKLASSNQETSRRQQVGRGLRLAVNQDGKRQTIQYCEEDDTEFYKINCLDVIVSGAEKSFIEGIQAEINNNSYRSGDTINTAMLLHAGFSESEASRLLILLEDNAIITPLDNGFYIQAPIIDFLKENRDSLHPALACKYDDFLKFFKGNTNPPVENRDKAKKMVSIRADKFKEFENLWRVITQKAKITYRDIHDDILTETIATKFNQENIDPIRIIIKTATYNAQKDEIEHKEDDTLGDINFFKSNNAYSDFIMEFAKKEKLPLAFVLKIFDRLDKQNIQNNPKAAYKNLAKFIKDAIHHNIIQSISYQFEGAITIQPDNKIHNIFYDNDGKPVEEIESSKLGRYIDKAPSPSHYLYDAIIYDSNIERDVVKTDPKTSGENSITVFAKLPSLSIPTPYKSYNPDFAYYIENQKGKKLFLIIETKGYDNEGDIPKDELMKIHYAERFFETLNQNMQDRNTEIIFKKRINKQELHHLLQGIGNE